LKRKHGWINTFFNKQEDGNARGTAAGIISATNNSTSSTSNASDNTGTENIETATTTGSESQIHPIGWTGIQE
jgi:hypothetical protein